MFQNDSGADETKESIVRERIGALIRGYRAGNQGYVVWQHVRSLFQGRNTHCCSKVFKYYIHEYFTPFFA